VCGDGKIEGSEGCDDQNNNPNEGCTNGCVVQCNDVHPEATQFQNHCYWRNTDDAPWAVASAACVAGGGHLVTIASQAENDFLSNLHEWFWIGATDGRGRMVPGVGTYTWVTGEPWDYTNWEQDRPNAQGNDCGASICYEHCAELQADGTWNDLDCGRQPGRDSVCEWDPPGQ
jgi:cysteine-rich repeat protein